MNEFAFTDSGEGVPLPPLSVRGESGAPRPAPDSPCPRCGGVLEAGLYGPCTACREALRVWAAKPRKRGRRG